MARCSYIGSDCAYRCFCLTQPVGEDIVLVLGIKNTSASKLGMFNDFGHGNMAASYP